MKKQEIERWEKRWLDDAAKLEERPQSASPRERSIPSQRRNQSRGKLKGPGRGQPGADQETIQRRDHGSRGTDREDRVPGRDEDVDKGHKGGS